VIGVKCWINKKDEVANAARPQNDRPQRRRPANNRG